MNRWDYSYVDISALIGKRIVQVDESSSSVHFHTECGKHYIMEHIQDCCESVYLDSVDGNLQGLVGGIVYSASMDSQDIPRPDDYDGIARWTFYRISTDREFVHLTWRGSSNGYYSVGVSFLEVPMVEPEENEGSDW